MNKSKDKTRIQEEKPKSIYITKCPLDAKESDIKSALKQYGKIEKVDIIINKDTKRSSGSAFITFSNSESAILALKDSKKAKIGEFMGIHIFGCKIEINQILNKEEIRAMKEDVVKDKRNLHLLTEDQIPHHSEEWSSFSKGDRQKRINNFNTKKLKLKNPIYSISPVRLAITNIPITFNKNDLKKLFLDTVELNLPNSEPKITQVKILYNGVGNNKISKGCGFVQFSEHEHALFALKYLNGRVNVFSKNARPIVDFAIDNVMMLVKKNEKLNKEYLSNVVPREKTAEIKKRIGEIYLKKKLVISKKKKKVVKRIKERKVKKIIDERDYLDDIVERKMRKFEYKKDNEKKSKYFEWF